MPATVRPDRILHDLSELWRTMGKEEKGAADGGVLRACAMTLIAFVDDEDDAMALGETLAQLMREHPSRLIVVRVRADGDALDARVFAQCWMPFGHRRQICCEQVEITASMGRLEDIPSIVAPLSVPDLPRVVWLRSARLKEPALLRHLIQPGDKIIVDSSRTGGPPLRNLTELLDLGYVVGDLAWTRITEIRELIADLLRDREPIDSAAIDYCGPEAGPEVRYLAGWLESGMKGAHVQLRRVEGAGRIREVRIEPGLQLSLEGTCAQFRLGSLHERASLSAGEEHQLLNEELRIAVHDRVFESVLREIAG